MKSIKSLPNSNDDKIENVEKVYVDWPEEEDSDVYRFVSSRIDNVDTDLAVDYGVDAMGDRSASQQRYEQVEDTANSGSHRSVPPLDLISQTSSVELPGAKGVIDIDLRSVSGDDDSSETTPRDSLDVALLPQVQSHDLILNPTEYDSIRRPESLYSDPLILGQGVESQDRKGAGQKTEAQIFESAKQRLTQMKEILSGNRGKKLENSVLAKVVGPGKKPTLLVAPQIKPSLTRAPNFVELNKSAAAQSKSQTGGANSYSSRFQDRFKQQQATLLSPNKEYRPIIEQNFHGDSDGDRPIKGIPHRVQSLERIPDHRGSYSPPQVQYSEYHQRGQSSGFETDNFSPHFREPGILYAKNQHGDPIVINTEQVIIANGGQLSQPGLITPRMPLMESHSTNRYQVHPILQQSHQQQHHLPDKHYQEVLRSPPSPEVSPEPAINRQPTLYDEALLVKKTQQSSPRSGSEMVALTRFPPLSSTGESKTPHNVQAPMTNEDGYAAQFRHKKEQPSYERYTMRDFRNLQNISRIGGLGPNTGSEEHQRMKEKKLRQKKYASAVKERNRVELQQQQQHQQHHQKSVEQMTVLDRSSGHSEVYRQQDKEKENEVSRQIGGTEEDGEIRSVPPIDTEEPPASRGVASSGNGNKDVASKREMMMAYAKTLRTKKPSKPSSSSTNPRSTPGTIKQSEIVTNDDLERLLQRHEDSKRAAQEIRMKLGKIS